MVTLPEYNQVHWRRYSRRSCNLHCLEEWKSEEWEILRIPQSSRCVVLLVKSANPSPTAIIDSGEALYICQIHLPGGTRSKCDEQGDWVRVRDRLG